MGTESLDEASNTRRIQIHMAGIYQRIFDRNPGLEKDMKENPHLVEQMLQQIPEAMANAIKADKKFGSVVHEEHKGPQEYEEIDGDITRIISMPERVPVFPIMIDREDREIAEKEKRERMAAQMEILRGQYLAARSYYARFPPFPYPPPYQMPQMPHMPPHMPPFMPPHFQPSYPPFGPR
ncbi:unnamed protein product [Caenorhabditis auriculariae]|uniref:Uncharacterized protein n=1 Tax=Caenorhabditis auriculariae TaxID=2777116 RepID=A0A8S1HCU2_9PELO|nr:unnamed protein product [Caenorhabditis auriculariae]